MFKQPIVRAALAAVLVGVFHRGALAEEPATLVVVGGRVWTADEQKPWAEAVAVRGSRILKVGSRDEVEALGDASTRVVDAQGGMVVPGFIDSHVHLLDGGLQLNRVQLRGARSREEFVDRLARYARRLQPGEWILGGEWDHTVWGGELPTRDWIDKVTPDNPVWIDRLDGHMALANSAALQLAGVDDSVEAPEGGSIERDANGRITGLLRDNAMGLVGPAVPAATRSQLESALDAASDYLLANGVTSVGHMGSLGQLRVLREVHAGRGLRVRVHAATPLGQWRQLLDDIERNGRGDEWLAAGGLKGFVDGSLGSHTAAMLEPFTDAPDDRGLLVTTADDLYEWTSAADKAGLNVMVHAIGDRAIRIQLDVYERVAKENGPRDRRFRIEHAQHIHPDDLPRFAELGVVPSMQPYHAIDDGRWAEAVIGHQRSETTYAFRDLLDTGAHLALGSDWSVAPASVIEGVYACVTRATLDDKHPGGWIPEQKITVEEALRGYTMGSAYSMFAEQDLGSLRAGKLADIVVLSTDLTKCPPESIRDAKVMVTIVDGEVAYEGPNATAE
ncbi:amidohydrolase [Aeoliella sp.]|uniref:amidohydrolase n=1 Tax=Aeoliella sp. TaxID=2795800 RepID=UPI003CCBDD4B